MSVKQIKVLLDFLEVHPELALAQFSRSKEGRNLSNKLWQKCADTLNGISSDSVQKSAGEWRTFYNEYKHRLLKKIKKEKNEKSATGGGPPRNTALTPLQERLYNILGRDVSEPVQGVRHKHPNVPHNPLPSTREHTYATNRLAAAVEALVDRLREPIKIVLEGPSEMVLDRMETGEQERIKRSYSDSDD